MTFDISYLVGKTVQIGDLTAKVLSATDTDIKLDPMTFTKYLNEWLVNGTTNEYDEKLHTSTDPLSFVFNVPLAVIPSSFSNIFINITYESRAYRNTLPTNTNHIFLNITARDDYFVTHRTELVTGLRIKGGSQFQTCVAPFWTTIASGDPASDHRFADTSERDSFFTSNPYDLIDELVVMIGGVWGSSPIAPADYNFVDNSARDAYFVTNPSELINNITARIGPIMGSTLYYATYGDFPATGVADTLYIAQDTGNHYTWSGSAYASATYTYQKFTCTYSQYTAETWIDVDPIYELFPVSPTMNCKITYAEGQSITPVIDQSGTSNTISGSYDGVCGNSNLSGPLGFRTTVGYTGSNLLDNHFRIETDITISYKNSLGETLPDGSGCIPKSLVSSVIHVITS